MWVFSINWIKERCRRANSPSSTIKRAPAILVAAAKFKPPRPSPRSTWSFTLKSNVGLSPHVSTSTLSSSSAPAGTLSWGMLGTPDRIVLSSSCRTLRAFLLASSLAPRSPTSANTPLASAPWDLSLPICLDLALRSPCKVSVATCSSLRWLSSSARRATSSS